MDLRTILILGAGFMQTPALKIAKNLGLRVCAVDGNPEACGKDLADEFLPIDLKDTDSLIKYALGLKADSRLDAVFTAATDFSASVAAIAEACHLPGHSLEAALNATDKGRMRSCFKAAGIASPLFAEIHESEKESALAIYTGNGASFPAVVKPVDNMGARGCKLVTCAEELAFALDDALRYSRTRRAVVEEFIQGPEFSLEGLVFNGKTCITAVADRHIFFPPYFIELGHTIPSQYEKKDTDELIAVFTEGARALGLRHGAIKGDIFLKEGKAVVGEIAARLSGGYMSGWTVPYSSGLNITKAAIQLALGEEPEDFASASPFLRTPTKHYCPHVSAERAWISIPGTVKSISGLEDASAVPFVQNVFPRAGVGDEVVFPQNNVEKCGNVISRAESRAAAVQASENACKLIVLRLTPHNTQTDIFIKTIHNSTETQQEYPPNFLQIQGVHIGSIAEQLKNCRFVCSKGFYIPDFLVEAKSVRDLQGRELIEICEQVLAAEKGLKEILCSFSDKAAQGKKRECLWVSCIRAGIQGILYMYDCGLL
ncbi:ATP-grasp domain-containing protein [Treponema phagedenis]|nr:ATP-grasp domain-containing protein [Treponema phagedenis]